MLQIKTGKLRFNYIKQLSKWACKYAHLPFVLPAITFSEILFSSILKLRKHNVLVLYLIWQDS